MNFFSNGQNVHLVLLMILVLLKLFVDSLLSYFPVIFKICFFSSVNIFEITLLKSAKSDI